jgi:hypothetical protein
MDTYVHIIVGAIVGDLVSGAVDRKVFKGRALDPKKTASTAREALEFGVVAGSGGLAALASHVATDVIPHADPLVNHGLIIPNRLWPLRELIAAILTAVAILIFSKGKRRLVLLASGFLGGLPDMESLFIGTGFLASSDAIFPAHNGTLPHGKNLGPISWIIELTVMGASFLALWKRRPK